MTKTTLLQQNCFDLHSQKIWIPNSPTRNLSADFCAQLYGARDSDCLRRGGGKLFQSDFCIGLAWLSDERESLKENSKVIFIRKKVFSCFCFFFNRAKSEILNCAIARELANSLSVFRISSGALRAVTDDEQLHTIPTYERNIRLQSFFIWESRSRSIWKFIQLCSRRSRHDGAFCSRRYQRSTIKLLSTNRTGERKKIEIIAFGFVLNPHESTTRTKLWSIRPARRSCGMKEIFFLLFKKTHFVSYLTTYTDTSHMYSGTESQTLQTSRPRSLDHLWVEGFSYTFLNLWSHIETGAHTTKPLLTEPPTHVQALTNTPAR